MESNEYLFIQIGFALLTLVCIVLFLAGLKKSIQQSDYSEKKKKHIWLISVTGISIWLLLVSTLSLSGFTQDFSLPPRLPLVILPPLLLALFLIFSGKTDRLLLATPQSWLIGFQSFRFFVEILLWALFAINLLPIQMTLEGYNWDIVTGISAPLVVLLFKKFKWPLWILVIWNIAGLILLINIVTIAILSFPFPFRVFMNEPANKIVAYFPIIFLPSVLVPFAYYMHFFSLRKLYLKSAKVSPFSNPDPSDLSH